MERSDALLIKDAQTGSLVSFEILVERYQAKLLRFVSRITKDTAASEDIVQETFIAIYTHLATIDPTQKFTTYLFEIAKNKSFTYLRKQKKQMSLSFDIETDEESGWIERLTQEEQKGAVQRALTTLSPVQQQVIRLYYYKQYGYSEISQKLMIPLNTVRTHLKRAKIKLKKELT